MHVVTSPTQPTKCGTMQRSSLLLTLGFELGITCCLRLVHRYRNTSERHTVTFICEHLCAFGWHNKRTKFATLSPRKCTMLVTDILQCHAEHAYMLLMFWCKIYVKAILHFVGMNVLSWFDNARNEQCKIYTFARCFAWVWNLVSHVGGRDWGRYRVGCWGVYWGPRGGEREQTVVSYVRESFIICTLPRAHPRVGYRVEAPQTPQNRN